MGFLTIDTGHYLNVALRLADFGESYYYVNWVEPFPRVEKYAIGWGFDNILKVIDYGSYIDENTVVFPDVGFGSVADFLRHKGIPVFGASYPGQMLELDRLYMYATMKDLGIATPPAEIIKGKYNVMSRVMKSEKPLYVKVPSFRGTQETFRACSPLTVDINLSKFGALQDELEYAVEEELEGGIEIAVDFLVGKEGILRPYHFSPEFYGAFNKWVDESPFDEVLNKLEPWLIEHNYRGAMSIEAIFRREDNDIKLYVLDITSRFGFPGSGALIRGYDNFGEVVRCIAENRDGCSDVAKVNVTYDFEGTLYTESNGWFKVVVSDEWLPNIDWKYVMKKGNEYWHVPESDVIGGVVIQDNDVEELLSKIDKAKRELEVGKGDQVLYANTNIIREKMKELSKILGYNLY